MTTTITSTTTQTQNNSTIDTGVSTPPSQLQKSLSLEDTVSALANSLSGFTSRCMEQPTSHPRMFARMERLVDSIARLVDAIANYRSSTKPDAAPPAQQAPVEVQSATSPENDISPTPPSTESPTPTPEPTPVVGAAPESEVVEQQASPPTDPKIELGAQLPPTGGFLWKPVSDKNGDLAVLLPKQYTGKVKQVRVLNADGSKVLAKGRYSGVGNGAREHYRFNKPGSGYPDGAIVLIEMENGALRHLKIKDTAKRTER
jgi:hypothetical protein